MLGVKCVVCKKDLKPIWDDLDGKPEQVAWDDAMVHDVYAGYGSKYDTCKFIIGMCEDCIEQSLEEGTLVNCGSWLDKVRCAGSYLDGTSCRECLKCHRMRQETVAMLNTMNDDIEEKLSHVSSDTEKLRLFNNMGVIRMAINMIKGG